MPVQTEKQQGQTARFRAYLAALTQQLGSYDAQINMRELTAFRAELPTRLDAFFCENRTLHLAVLGQVKSGKSSFLNELLFGGDAVLPHAITPKTTVLTQIEYSAQNELCVTYYQPDEWDALERLARASVASEMVRAAQEMVTMAVDAGTDVARLLAMGQQTIPLGSQAEIAAVLNHYVGEDGQMTPVVKNVTLRLCQPALKGIVVVDTPGLNDPVVSRTEKTKQYLENCDIAFFLSRSGHFLDQTDLQLLTKQLPQKGLRQMVLVASLFDEALTDCIYDYANLADAVQDAKVQLRRHAMHCIQQAVAQLQGAGYPPEILQVVEGCKRPLFVSALAQKMGTQPINAYTPQARLVKKLLCTHERLTQEQLAQLGGFAEVNALFAQMMAEKEQTLAQKADALVLTMQLELREILLCLQQTVQHEQQTTQQLLQQNQQASAALHQQMQVFLAQIQQIFETERTATETRLTEAIFALRQIAKTEGELAVHTDVKSRAIPREVQDSVFYKPWTWNKTHTEYTLRNDSAPYVSAEDVVLSAQRLQEWTQSLWGQVVQSDTAHQQLQIALRRVLLDYCHQKGVVMGADAAGAQLNACLRLQPAPTLAVGQPPAPIELTARYPQRLYGTHEQPAFRQVAQAYLDDVLKYLTTALEATLPQMARAYQDAQSYFEVQMFAEDKISLQNLQTDRQALQKKAAIIAEVAQVLAQYIPR